MTAAQDGTLDLKDDAVTADKVKDGETLPVNISGIAKIARTLIGENMVSGTNGYSLLATLEISNINAVYAGAMFAVVCRGGGACFEGIVSASLSEYTSSGNETAPIVGNVTVMNCRGANLGDLTSKFDFYLLRIEAGKYQLYVHKKENGLPVSCTLLAATECTCTLYSSGALPNLPTAIETKKLNWICNKSVGSPSNPVYVDSNGQVQPCLTPVIIDKIVNEDGTDIVISKSVTFEDSSSWKTLGKLNISPQDATRIVDFTFMLDDYYSYDSQNMRTGYNVIFGVFVGNTEVARYVLHPSTNVYESSQSFRCSFTANINNTIYIKVQRQSANEPHSASFEFPRVKGLIL